MGPGMVGSWIWYLALICTSVIFFRRILFCESLHIQTHAGSSRCALRPIEHYRAHSARLISFASLVHGRKNRRPTNTKTVAAMQWRQIFVQN